LDNRNQWPLAWLRSQNREVGEQFVDAHYTGLYRWFLWLTNDREWAADLTQETFLAFWTSLRTADGNAPAKLWLLSVGRNVWRNACRARRRSGELRSRELAHGKLQNDQSDGPLASSVRSECLADIRSAVAELAPEYREAVALRYWEDLSYAEISRVLDISEELARWRVFQGRRLLRERLKHWAEGVQST